MVAKRIAAAVAAVAMIAAALWWRRDDGQAAGPSSATGAERVVCATELRAACDELARAGRAVTVEAAGTTAERLVAEDPVRPTTWITLAPWPEVVDARRTRAGLSPRFGAAAVVADRGIVAHGRPAPCPASPTWACVAALDRVGIDDPTRVATGLPALVAVVTGLTGQDAAGLSLTDPAVRDAVAAFRARMPVAPNADTPVVDVLRLFPGTFAAAVALDDATSPATAPTPAVRAGVAVAADRGAPEAVRAAAARLGAPASASTGLPSGDVAYGLQLAWQQG